MGNTFMDKIKCGVSFDVEDDAESEDRYYTNPPNKVCMHCKIIEHRTKATYCQNCGSRLLVLGTEEHFTPQVEDVIYGGAEMKFIPDEEYKRKKGKIYPYVGRQLINHQYSDADSESNKYTYSYRLGDKNDIHIAEGVEHDVVWICMSENDEYRLESPYPISDDYRFEISRGGQSSDVVEDAKHRRFSGSPSSLPEEGDHYSTAPLQNNSVNTQRPPKRMESPSLTGGSPLPPDMDFAPPSHPFLPARYRKMLDLESPSLIIPDGSPQSPDMNFAPPSHPIRNYEQHQEHQIDYNIADIAPMHHPSALGYDGNKEPMIYDIADHICAGGSHAFWDEGKPTNGAGNPYSNNWQDSLDTVDWGEETAESENEFLTRTFGDDEGYRLSQKMSVLQRMINANLKNEIHDTNIASQHVNQAHASTSTWGKAVE